MERRWKFLAPFYAALRGRVVYKKIERDDDAWSDQKFRLEVRVPRRYESPSYRQGFVLNGEDEAIFRLEIRKVREALALLAAVAHVDPEAWKNLLREKCGVRMGKKGEEKYEKEVPVEFVLKFDLQENKKTKTDESLGLDFLLFLDINHQTDLSAEYVKALAKIAKMDTRLQSGDPGVDITIPVRVLYKESDDSAMKNSLNIGKAENVIQEQWGSLQEEPVKARSLRCTFELKPMIADFDNGKLNTKMVKTMETLMADNVWFSQFEIFLDAVGDVTERKNLFQLLTNLFGGSSNSTTKLNPLYHICAGDGARQIHTLNLKCERSMGSWEFGAVLSAMMLNCMTKNLSVYFNCSESEDGHANHKMWMWLAYAAFSKLGCSIEELTLCNIKDMKLADMKAFASVVMADHPEEVLCGGPRGQIDEHKATLSKGSKVRWEPDEEGQPRVKSRALALPDAARDVRAFSDDGQSDLVNVVIPGFGHCLVQRDDLVSQKTGSSSNTEHRLRSLTIQFQENDDDDDDNNDDDEEEEDGDVGTSESEVVNNTNGLAFFLETIGSSLGSLALDGPRADVDENLIIQSCPNLQKLSLCGGQVNVQLSFEGYRVLNVPVPQLGCHWHNIADLSAALSNTSNPLANCVRRLRVQLKDEWEGWQVVPQSYNPPDFESNAKELLQMLERNQRLEYLEVIAPEEHQDYVDRFSTHHLKPIKQSVERLMRCHIPFLSAISSLRASQPPPKKQKASASNLSHVVSALDQHLLTNIIQFAFGSSLRQVYFSSQDDSGWDEEDDHIFFRI